MRPLVAERRHPGSSGTWPRRQLLGLLPPPELIALVFFAAAISLHLLTRG